MDEGDGNEAADVELEDLEIAVAHWHVRSWGGAEYLVTKLAEALDEERVYTLGAPGPDDPNPYGDVEFVDVLDSLRASWFRRLQNRIGRVFEYALWEDVDWRDFGDPDVLVTSGATARAVITPDDTLHVNYCHSPPRWFYDLYHDRKDSWKGLAARPFVRYLRMRDMTLDPRVDRYLANSPIIKRRLWKYYKRDAEVLYPPVEMDEYRNESDEGFYLHLGRLDGEKGVPEIVEAFAGTNRELVLAGGRGDMSEAVMERIQEADNIKYRGFVNESEKLDLLATCCAVVFNGRNEDFGIVPIEANASGKPILAREEGFPAVFVDDGENGLLHDGSPRGIKNSIERIESTDSWTIDESIVEQFSQKSFSEKLRREITSANAALEVRNAED